LFIFKKLFDISVCLGRESITYPGDPEFERELLGQINEENQYELSRLNLSSHSGTHIDAPAHFIKGGKRIHELAVEDFLLTAHVVEIKNHKAITSAEIQNTNCNPGEALLFKTDNSKKDKITSGVFSADYVYLTPEAAKFCVSRKVKLVGIDYITIDKPGSEQFESHKILLTQGIIILESINLQAVPQGIYTLLCLPLKIYQGEAAPVRAVLLK
jgi:arylformamidase